MANTVKLIAYKNLLKCLNKYHPIFMPDGVQFKCPATLEDEKILNLTLKVYVFKIDEPFLHILNGKTLLAIIKSDLIKKKNVFSTFNNLVKNGVLQTINLLCMECGFDCFTFPDETREAKIKFDDRCSYVLKDFKFVGNVNVNFRYPVSNKRIYVERKNLLSYFTTRIVKTLSFDNKFFKILNFFDNIDIPKDFVHNHNFSETEINKINFHRYKSNRYYIRINCIQSENAYYAIKYMYKGCNIYLECFSVCSGVITVNTMPRIIYSHKIFESLNKVKEFIDILESLLDYSDDSSNEKFNECNCIGGTLEYCNDYKDTNYDLISFCDCNCHNHNETINIRKYKNDKKKAINQKLHNELNEYFLKRKYQSVLTEIDRYNDAKTKQSETRQSETIQTETRQSETRQSEQEKFVDNTIKTIKQFSNVFKCNTHLIKTLGPELFLTFFDKDIHETDREFLKYIEKNKDINIDLILEIFNQ